MPKILLVEDNEMNREMLSRRLVRKGFEVVIAVDGLQGVAMASTERPALVLLDMSLPGIDGWEVARRLRADPATQALPVIALTAHAMSEDRERALAAGCNEFDTKPVDLERLLGKMNSLLQPSPQDAALWALELSLPAAAQSLPELQAALDNLCVQAAVDQEAWADLRVVLDEVCANIFEHAYPPDARGLISITLRHLAAQPNGPAARPAAVELSFVDQGQPFDPLSQPAPDLTLPLEDRPIGGLGIALISQLTDSQSYNYSVEQGNRLTVVKHLVSAPAITPPTGATSLH